MITPPRDGSPMVISRVFRRSKKKGELQYCIKGHEKIMPMTGKEYGANHDSASKEKRRFGGASVLASRPENFE
jgi:hypothetical protein